MKEKIAKKTNNQQIIAIGHKAKVMRGRSHADIDTIRPIRDGVVAGFQGLLK